MDAVQKTDAFLPFKGCLYYLKTSNIFCQRRSHSALRNSKLKSLTRSKSVFPASDPNHHQYHTQINNHKAHQPPILQHPAVCSTHKSFFLNIVRIEHDAIFNQCNQLFVH